MSDDHSLNSEAEEEEDVMDMDEDEIDDYLQLPKNLQSIGVDEKRELYKFKESRSDLQWEEKITEMQDKLSRKIDMERLKRMKNKVVADEDKQPIKRGRSKVVSKAPTSRRKTVEEEDKFMDELPLKTKAVSDSKPAEVDDMEEDDDDDLFDSDEEKMISEFHKDEQDDFLVDEDNDNLVKEKKILGGKRRSAVEKDVTESKKLKQDEIDGGARRSSRINDQSKSKEVNYEEDNSFALVDDSDSSDHLFYQKRSQLQDHKFDDDDDDDDDDNYDALPASRSQLYGDSTTAMKDNEADSENDDDDDDDSPLAEFEDYRKLQMRRALVDKYINEPYFERMMVGSFVRVFTNYKNGIRNYQMAEVMRLNSNAKEYLFTTMDQKKLKTTIRMDLGFGGIIVKSNAKLDLISNSRVTDDEYERYLKNSHEAVTRANRNRKVKLLTKKLYEKRRERMVKAPQYQYSEKDIEDMIKRRHGDRLVHTKEFSLAKDKLIRRLEKAISEEDTVQVMQIQRAIEKLEHEIENEKKIFEKKFSQVLLNKRNKRLNYDKDEAAAGATKTKLGRGPGEQSNGVMNQGAQDPFIRRETRPKNIWKTGAILQQEKRAEEIQTELKALKDRLKNVVITDDIDPLDFEAKEAAEKQYRNQIEMKMKSLEMELEQLHTVLGLKKGKTDDKKQEEKIDVTKKTGTGRVEEDSSLWHIGYVTLEQIRQRVFNRIKVDPIAESRKDRRQRYLERVCPKVLKMNKEEREQYRNGKSLEEMMKLMDENRQRDAEEG
jgi:hypothetical protein